MLVLLVHDLGHIIIDYFNYFFDRNYKFSLDHVEFYLMTSTYCIFYIIDRRIHFHYRCSFHNIDLTHFSLVNF